MKLGRRQVLIGTFALVAATSCLPSLKTRGAGPTERARAPAFSLVDHRGRQVTLDSLLLRGPAVLVFYRGHW